MNELVDKKLFSFEKSECRKLKHEKHLIDKADHWGHCAGPRVNSLSVGVHILKLLPHGSNKRALWTKARRVFMVFKHAQEWWPRDFSLGLSP